MLLLILLVVIIVLLAGTHPGWGYHSYGYRPVGLLGFCLIIVLILWAVGKI